MDNLLIFFKTIIKRTISFFLSIKIVRKLFIDKNNLKVAIGERHNYQLFKKKSWLLIDHKNSDINFNFEKDDKLNIDSNSVKFLYSSHMVEHLTDDGLKKFIDESYRILHSNCYIRIEAPDAEIFINSYINKNNDYLNDFIKNGEELSKKYNNDQYKKFHNCFMSSIISFIKDDMIEPILVKKSIVDEKLKDLDTFDKWTKTLLNEKQKNTHGHINLIYYSKMKKLLQHGGFTDIKKVNFQESHSTIGSLYLKEVERIIDRNKYSIIIEAKK